MITVQDVCNAIESWAPLSFQESWDNSGLCIGDRTRSVTHAILALDVTEEVVDEAISKGAQMIITHHPAIFSGIKRLTLDTMMSRALYKAISHNIVLYAAHTNADKAADGVSAIMAKKLELTDCQFLSKDAPCIESGLGIIGNTKEPIPVATFLALIKKQFDLKTFKYSSAITGLTIKRVALCGGSGSSLIADALAAGADIFVTADISYHHYFETVGKMILADIGHYESEVDILMHFKDVLKEKLPTFAAEITKIRTNPILYY